jgi:hypothetical protein
MKNVKKRTGAVICLLAALTASRVYAGSTTVSETVTGTDAIFLANRTDVTIAPPGAAPAGYPLLRNSPPGPYSESFPPAVSATGGQTFQFSASGDVNYNINVAGTVFGPDGVRPSTFNSVAGISGYNGPIGALLGVFLTNTDPENTTAPATLNFSTSTAFTTLSPGIGQVFFIGDGLTGTGSGTVQDFIAPPGATELYLGVADAPNFLGAPGGYDDNTGSFNVSVTASSVPEPATAGATVAILSLLASRRRRTRSQQS